MPIIFQAIIFMISIAAFIGSLVAFFIYLLNWIFSRNEKSKKRVIGSAGVSVFLLMLMIVAMLLLSSFCVRTRMCEPISLFDLPEIILNFVF